jgi:hypothetical protein
MADLSTPGAARIRGAADVLLSVAPSINNSALQIFLSQVKHENDFGYASPFDRTPDGSPSNNWGAIYAKGDKGTIPVGDTADGKPFTAGAAWWSSPEGGARQFYNLVTGNSYKAYDEAAAGDAWAYSLALFREGKGYYGGFPPGHKWSLAPADATLHGEVDHYYRALAYAKAIMGHANTVAKALGQPLAVHLTAPTPPTESGGGVGTALLVGGAALAAYHMIKTLK